MASKAGFITEVQQLAHNFGVHANWAKDLTDMYFDRGYNSGGADEIVDGDVSDNNFTASDVGAFITLCQQFDNLLNNATVTEGDYDVTLSKIRVDQVTRQRY